jgi:hypothetical protein
MKKLLCSLSFVLILSLCIASLAVAQSIPRGSYRQTCRNIRVDGNGLYATCETRNGSWKDTNLSSNGFPCDDIENDDGELVCVGPSN